MRIRLRPVPFPAGQQTESEGELEMLKTSLNGISSTYERSGKGSALVLIHGFPLDHTIWDMLVPILKKHADVIVPDLRGFGEAAISPGDYSLNDLASDIASLLDQL